MIDFVPGCGLWNRQQTACWLGIHTNTLDRLRRRDSGLAACVRHVGARVLYSPAELAKWVEQSKRNGKRR